MHCQRPFIPAWTRFSTTITLLFGVITLVPSATETAIAQSLRSPQVNDDNTVTVRLKAANAKEVVANIAGQRLKLTQNEGRIWEGTSASLPAGIHDYTFQVDGTMMIDPSNRNVKKWLTMASMVEIPGKPALLTEMQSVPHGSIQRCFYPSSTVGTQRPVMVYTPPDYHAVQETKYPLVLLLHGFGDDETAWTEVGRANFIADNLIAQGKIGPCIIAMPYGHPVPVPVEQRPDDYFASNNDVYEQDIMKDLLPFLESRYSVRNDREGRSIVGLSMGGGHALDTGLKNIEKFSAIGAFSAAVPQLSNDDLIIKYPALAGPSPAANQLQHLWIPIGDKDFLLQRNQSFIEQIRENHVQFDFHLTSGGHEWKLWREYLPEFLIKVVGK
ncbi:MAG: alpha/beta hydrolase-fold protein [Planctomycetaceae bacterium]